MWFCVVSVAVWTVLQAVKHRTLNRITVNVSDVDIDFFMLLLGFDKLLGKGFFGASGTIQAGCASGGGISRHSATFLKRFVTFGTFTYKDTARGVVTVVACVDSYTIKAGDIVQEREQSAELR